MKNSWFEMWCADYDSLIMTAMKNLKADLDAGYNPNGASIQRSRETITEFEKRYMNGLEKFKSMTPAQVQHWCHMDMKKRGAI